MGLKDLCWCTNSHHPCGPSTTVSTQLIFTNLEHKPLSLFHLTAIILHSTGKMVKNKDAIVNSNTIIYPRSTWQTAVHLHTMHTRPPLHTTATTTCTLCTLTTTTIPIVIVVIFLTRSGFTSSGIHIPSLICLLTLTAYLLTLSVFY